MISFIGVASLVYRAVSGVASKVLCLFVSMCRLPSSHSSHPVPSTRATLLAVCLSSLVRHLSSSPVGPFLPSVEPCRSPSNNVIMTVLIILQHHCPVITPCLHPPSLSMHSVNTSSLCRRRLVPPACNRHRVGLCQGLTFVLTVFLGMFNAW